MSKGSPRLGDWDAEDQAYYERDCHAARRACQAFFALGRRGVLRKDLVQYIAREFIWPTRKYKANWRGCSTEGTGKFEVRSRYQGDAFLGATWIFVRLK